MGNALTSVPSGSYYAKSFSIDPGFKQTIGGIEEIVAMVLDVKADQVASSMPSRISF
jgi:hypothetical protein